MADGHAMWRHNGRDRESRDSGVGTPFAKLSAVVDACRKLVSGTQAKRGRRKSCPRIVNHNEEQT
jgi:hypothetical protein